MNRKIPLGITIGLLVFALAISSVITAGVITRQYDSLLGGMPEKLERFGIVDELDDIINANYYGRSDVEDLERALAQGYVQSLTDENSVYMTASEYKTYLSEKDGKISGIGIAYKKTAESYLELTAVKKSSPAYAEGLRKGDIIIGFDGIILDAENYSEMTARLVDDKLSSINIIYRRGDTETSVSVSKGYEAVSVSTSFYENVGYIEISDFYPSTAAQVEQAINKFTSSQIDAIVIDLRDNSSYNYDAAMEILDIFVPMSDSKRPAATVVDADGKTVKTYTTTAGEINLPVGVLVSDSTSQAAELFACNLRDFGKAVIFAEKTSGGSAVVTEAFVLSEGSAVLLTTGKVLPHSGVSFDGTGIEPDYLLEKAAPSKEISEDGQFLFAVSVLTE